MAAGPLTPGGPTDLVTINPGSNTLGVLAGLGGGRFANPVAIQTQHPAQVVRMADFNHDGIPDLALLGTSQVTILLGDGQGGFQPPVSYDAGLEPTGLTVADINGDGVPDLLIGNVYGDLLILQGNGDGTFRPYRKADQAVALAVADLTGDGKPDFIYADQGLDRVVVQYGSDQTTVLGDQSSGLLSPGAVKLADLNGDGIPDLIVANSGSNNVLVYPGTGRRPVRPGDQRRARLLRGHQPDRDRGGEPERPARPDRRQQRVERRVDPAGPGHGLELDARRPGRGSRPTAGRWPWRWETSWARASSTSPWPTSRPTTSRSSPASAAGSSARPRRPTPWARRPAGCSWATSTARARGSPTLNAGSNTISLIGPGGVTQTIPTGGSLPRSGFAGDFTGSGFTDLVVGNSGDGRFSLFTGGAGGLSLSQSITSAEAPRRRR